MLPSDLALFRAYPGLRERCPRLAVTSLPTPVARLSLPGVAPGALYVKRDDLSCPLYGGNKPRKLEFVIGAAQARGSRRLVTTGGLGTHHGLATAILGRAAGLETTLVLVHQPVTAEVERALLLHAAWGAELVYGGNVPGAAVRTAAVLARATLRGERPFLVATGGSSPVGTAGFVSAGLELAEQIRAGALPEPEEIYAPVGTGGTLAGLLAGVRLAGLRSRVVGVLVTDILPPSPAGIARAARRALAWLARRDPALPRLPLTAADVLLLKDQLGEGYGAPTPAGREALGIAADAGLALEATYTAKCLAAVLARARSGDLRGPALFWNTYNGVDVAATAPLPLSPDALPPRFRAFLSEHRGGGQRGSRSVVRREAMDASGPPGVRLAATRRGFLRLAGATAALTALSQVRVLPQAALAAVDRPRTFDAAETEILTQVMERMVETGEPDAPRLRDTNAVGTVEGLCRHLEPSVVDQLRFLVRAFEWAPVFVDFRFSRFTGLSDAEKDASLRDWMESRIGLRRLGFAALRNLSMVGYYSQDATWPLIGYEGPLLGRKAPA